MHLISLIAVLAIIVTIAALLWRKSELALTLAVGNFAVFIISLFAAFDLGLGGLGWVQFNLGFRPDLLFELSKVHTLVTHMFLHSGFSHLIFNMLFLLLIGTQLEARVGKRLFLSIYFLGGLLAALTHGLTYWTPSGFRGGAVVVMVGASGAISALMGAMLLLYPHDEISFFVGPLFLPRVKVWISVGIWLVLQGVFLIADRGGGVAYGAHIGGFAAGVLIARLTHYRVLHDYYGEEDEPQVPWEELQDLALSPSLMQALKEIREADELDVLIAWVEHFSENAACPSCGGTLLFEGSDIACQSCNWRRRVL